MLPLRAIVPEEACVLHKKYIAEKHHRLDFETFLQKKSVIVLATRVPNDLKNSFIPAKKEKGAIELTPIAP